MSQFDDRKRASETKYQLDQDLEFKAQARRAKLVGLWAASLMGLADEAAADYAKSVVMADLEEAKRRLTALYSHWEEALELNANE